MGRKTQLLTLTTECGLKASRRATDTQEHADIVPGFIHKNKIRVFKDDMDMYMEIMRREERYKKCCIEALIDRTGE